MQDNKPNLFIVGAGKAGTFSIYRYLSQHPEVFMSGEKEPNYFGSDLIFRKPRLTQNEYLSLFRRAEGSKRAGEASVSYLMSKSAPAEIASFSDDPRIVIMLRDPIEVLHSRHNQNVVVGNEDILDFQAALDAEGDRRQGRRIPYGVNLVNDLFYSDWIRFAEQVKRYRKEFGQDRVSIILYDDFRRDPILCFKKLCAEIGVNDDFSPLPERFNANKKVRNHVLNRAIEGNIQTITSIGRILLPNKRLRQVVKSSIDYFNKVPTSRQPLEPHFERELRNKWSREIYELSHEIERDLSNWCDYR